MSSATPPDEFELSRLQAALSDWELHFFPELESTNDWALQTYRAHPPARPCLIVAQKQTRGRGRGSHTWQAPAGNLTCSFAFQLAPSASLQTPGKRPSWPAQLSLASGLAVQEAVSVFQPVSRSEIKWPNDLLIAGRKVAGILIETPHSADPDHVGSKLVVIGIGINVNSAPPITELDKPRMRAIPPTSLAAESRRPIDLTKLLTELANSLARWLATTGLMLRPSGPALAQPNSASELLERYEQALAWRGELVVLQRGEHQLVGKLLGVDKLGQLLIQPTDGAPVPVASGELRLAEQL